MLIGALSLVMFVWLGTSMNCSRRSTRMPALDDRDHEDPARALDLLRARAAEREDQEPLVLVDDLDRGEEEDQEDDDQEDDRDEDRQELHRW